MPKQTAIHSVNIFLPVWIKYLLYFIIVLYLIICNVFNVAPVLLYITTGYVRVWFAIDHLGICCTRTMIWLIVEIDVMLNLLLYERFFFSFFFKWVSVGGEERWDCTYHLTTWGNCFLSQIVVVTSSQLLKFNQTSWLLTIVSGQPLPVSETEVNLSFCLLSFDLVCAYHLKQKHIYIYRTLHGMNWKFELQNDYVASLSYLML